MIKDSTTDFKKGDVLSESSHYIVLGHSGHGNMVTVLNTEDGAHSDIGVTYLRAHAVSADLYTETVEVTKEDKADGTSGIRSIFEGIHSADVFTVCFLKQDKKKSAKALKAEIDAKAQELASVIDSVKSSKKGVANASKQIIEELMNNPILPFVPGDARILRGYKVQFVSRDGRYDCRDLDIEVTEKEAGIRPVNINTIQWLIYNNVKYVVK